MSNRKPEYKVGQKLSPHDELHKVWTIKRIELNGSSYDYIVDALDLDGNPTEYTVYENEIFNNKNNIPKDVGIACLLIKDK